MYYHKIINLNFHFNGAILHIREIKEEVVTVSEGHLIAHLGQFSFNLDTIITMWITMGILIIASFLATRKLSVIPTKLQAVAEGIMGAFVGLTESMIGKNGRKHIPLLATLFLFILTANLLGQLPWRLYHLKTGELASPTNDLNTTAALAVFVLIFYLYKGIKAKGLSYFKHYVQPVWFMTPFNIMEDFTRPLTLAIRLFANILAGEILIMVLAAIIASVLTPEGVQSFVQNIFGGILPSGFVYNTGLFLGSLLPLPVMFFELFVAFIQALVFTLLASAYIQGATAKSH